MVSLFTLAGVGKATNGAVAGDSNWSAITSYLASGTTTDSALTAVSPGQLASIYTGAFASTMIVVAVVVGVAGVTMYLLLKSKKAAAQVEQFLGLNGPRTHRLPSNNNSVTEGLR